MEKNVLVSGNMPYLFPYIGYWQLINAVDKFVIFDTGTFSKHRYVKRNTLANNQAFVVELIGAKSSTLVKDLKVDLHSKHNVNVLETIRRTYRKSKYFDDVYPMIEQIMTMSTTSYDEVLIAQIKAICSYLQIKTELIIASEVEQYVPESRTERVINFIKQAGGATCFNPAGEELYNKQEFKNNGIDLWFFYTKEKSRLSILDYLFNYSIGQIQQTFSNYLLT